MQVGSEAWKTLLIEGAVQAGLTIDRGQADRMAVHAKALVEWNRKINLTAITDATEIAIKHFLDAVLPMVHIPSQGWLLDMGTGGGFPGIPLKIMRSAQPMTLIDGSRKKINFVKHVLRQLAATDIDALQMRAEALGRETALRQRFQVIVCRALADLETIADMAAELLSPAGRIYVYQGPGDDVANAHARNFQLIDTFNYTLPVLGDRRRLTVISLMR